MKMVEITEAELRQKVEGNIFRFAYGAVEPWDTFPWHLGADRLCDTWKPHASQALAIDLFGTIKMLSQTDRDIILGRIAAELGIPATGPWKVELEWNDLPANRLRESGGQKSQIDARATSPGAEAK